MSIISKGLFERALIEPVKQGADELLIVSGYGTATMAARHIDVIKSLHATLKIRLIIGMSPLDGIEKRNHISLMEIHQRIGKIDFKCNYIINKPPVHAKVYTWLKGGIPILGLAGSANYTQSAFSPSMREILVEHEPHDCFSYYNTLIGETVECTSELAPDFIDIYERRTAERRLEEDATESITAGVTDPNLDSVELTLLDKRTGQVPERSGLNWGQRPEYKRNPNQAYLNIPATIIRSGFFPDRTTHFTVVTDDDKNFICVRAQDNGKGIETPLNNSLLGEYFRYRLGLSNGAPVTVADLRRYGRDSVTFYKIDEESYYMDFAVR
ncbi:NgoFVII family restriction endonuclease [Spirosoma flavus]